ncbi:hypothetical protein C3V36_01670 [Lachnospiraceae bacterium oral taxon 500]|nr:hypothetical protein C3V36_01670 [Lachnospiraceae bacterium oral taxon 500]
MIRSKQFRKNNNLTFPCSAKLEQSFLGRLLPGQKEKHFDQGVRCFQKGYPFRRRAGTIGKQGVIPHFDELRSLCESLKIMVLARNEFHYQHPKIIQPIKAPSAVQIADGAF